MTGKIYIASMNICGKWTEPINKDTLSFNVTICQLKKNNNRLVFSPMT